MRICRKSKKKLRAIILCHTGNYIARKEKVSKSKWIKLKKAYEIWFRVFSNEYKIANTIKRL